MSWILFLSVVGIILICLEAFAPGTVLGVVGTLCLIGAVILTYLKHGTIYGHTALFSLLMGSAIIFFLWITFFPKTRSGRAMITSRTLADSKSADPLESLKGKSGQALSPLRPAGVALIGNQRVDVIAESGLIDAETPIQVIRVEGNRVFVRKMT